MENVIAVDVKTNVGTIESNLREVKRSILAKTEEYKSVVFTEDQIVDGKKFLADIRKEKDALDRQRKDIKKAWMKPFDDFEKQAKEIIALYDEPIQAVNDQLSAYEKRRIEEKREVIRQIYTEEKGDLEDWLPLGDIWNGKWENKGCTEKQIRQDIRDRFDQLIFSLDTIRGMHSEFEKDAFEVLRKTGDVREALAKINALTEQKKRFEEAARRKAEEEMQAKLEAERARIAEEEREKTAQEAAESALNCEVEEVPAEADKAPQKAAEEAFLPFAAEEADAELPFEKETPFVHSGCTLMSVTVPEELVPELRRVFAKYQLEWKEEGV